MRDRWDHIGDIDRSLTARLDIDDLMLPGVAAAAFDPDTRLDDRVLVEEAHNTRVFQRYEIFLEIAGAIAFVWMCGVLPFGGTNQVLRVRESRPQRTALTDRRAAEMIEVQVRRQRDVD